MQKQKRGTMLRITLLLLSCIFAGSRANRVYVHPFTLFAAEDVSCETLQSSTTEPVQTITVSLLDMTVLTQDDRNMSQVDTQRQNITQKTAVLAELLNSVCLRMYQALSGNQQSSNTLLSPVNTYGSLATLFLGASKKTASFYQELLGLRSATDREDCVSLVDGHKVLQTLQSINSLVDDGPKDEIHTQVWVLTELGTEISEDFVQGTQDFSDSSFIRSLDFSNSQEAEQQINSFVDKTSGGKVNSIFTGLNTSSNFLFLSSFSFQGNWRAVFQPEKTSQQEFYVDDTTTVMAPLMTRIGPYYYLNDKVHRCTVVKLPLSKRSYMLLVLPHEGTRLRDIELNLLTVMPSWNKNLQEGLLELSLPKFSMSAVNDLHDLLNNMSPEVAATLLGAKAEFSKLSNTKPFTVDKVLNKVLFEMSEDATEVQGNIHEGGIPLRLLFNRPFFFAVIEEGSGAILLLGKVTNPTL